MATLYLPIETHDKLHDLCKRTDSTKAMREAIRAYRGEHLSNERKGKQKQLNLTEEELARLDEIKEQNNLKSRNEAAALLIDLAWAKMQAKAALDRARLAE